MRVCLFFAISCLNLQVLADSESEGNGSEATADVLNAGITMTGNLSSADDWDYFKLELSSSENLKLKFSSPNSKSSDENRWLVALQNPRQGFLVLQEILYPSEENTIERNITVNTNGTFFLIVAPAPDTALISTNQYEITAIPSNFQAPLGTFDGIWSDNLDIAFYSLHETPKGLLYVALSPDGSAWTGYLGGRISDTAVLNQIIGAGSATLELKFISPSQLEARYTSCQTNKGEPCALAIGSILYRGKKIFPE